MADGTDPWKPQLEAFGTFVRAQRQLAQLTLREMAERAMVSNPYLSQVERGLHEPSIRVIKAIARALGIPAETLLAQVGLIDNESDDPETGGATEAAIATDPHLTREQRRALLAVYHSFRAAGHGHDEDAGHQGS